MPLPELNATGDLLAGVHRATLAELLLRFGSVIGQRGVCARRLSHVFDLAVRTGYVKRLIVFGSFITAKEQPNDVDVILVMDDKFRLEDCPMESRGLFDHAVAQARYGASVFWVRPQMLIEESVEEFVAYWQIKRDRTQRGIVEVIIS
jgi:hypothetical protein